MELDRDACYRAVLARDARFDGRFFTCVRSTGIYCRPTCPARAPKLANVVFLPSAAAAQEAGFRPCLRCRPETTPELGAWHGSSATVRRAVALIAEGALDRGSVDDLAGRLGIGERQLRRLFRQHLGASPNAVAQTRRTLFAKQLVTDTRLPLAEVALAAGFGSIRRFNATFQALYGRPPSRLRKARGDAPAGSAVELRLAYQAPYDWAGITGFLAARAIPGVEVVRDGGYARSIALGGEVGSLGVRPAEKGAALIATIRFPRLAALPAIVARIRRIFDLGANPVLIAEQLGADPRLAGLVALRPGLRVPGAWDGFELAVRAILGQQITVAGATRLAGKLVGRYGARLPEPVDGLTHVFPPPERIADADPALELGMPRSRGAALRGMAQAAAADPRLFDPGGGLDEAIARLVALPGIGEWTAQYIAMRALREPDAFPAADIGLMRAMATPQGRPSAKELLAHAAAWRPWRAYAALHLWASDPLTPTEGKPLDAAA
jgi:AraC family transcriptional regulator of adaptative response / DNA-3-methyladenine glycosylase II